MADDTVRRIKDAADIIDIIGEHVTLHRSGSTYKGLCPFHSEKTPSFFVNPARQTFHCFGCNEGGDVFSFLMKYNNVSFVEAMRELAGRYNIPLPAGRFSRADADALKKRKALEEINRQAAKLYHEFLVGSRQAAPARSYLADRRIPDEIIERFQLGYAPDDWHFIGRRLAGAFSPELLSQAGLLIKKEQGGWYDRFRNRILCPISDLQGKVAGFGGRIIGDGQPKYLNTDKTLLFDKSRLLFGLYQNRQAIRRQRQCLLVEGNFDLLALAAHGVDTAIAPLGTALTEQQLKILKGFTDQVVLLFDGDEAGRKAAMRSISLFLAAMIEARIAVLPAGHDPDSFIREAGRDGLQELVNCAVSLPDFAFDFLVEKYGLSINGKARISEELHAIIAPLAPDSIQRTLFTSHFSEKLGVPVEQLQSGKPVRRRPPQRPPGPVQLPIKHRQLLQFILAWPEYLPAFRQAGIEELLAGSAASSILRHLIDLHDTGQDAAAEQLLDRLAGPEKSLVTAMLTRLPDYPEETVDAMAAEMIRWLEKSCARVRRQKLMAEILEAQKSGDMNLLLQLMEKKKKLDELMIIEEYGQ